ncbi:hypothetical protein PgNI_11144 [Pyricularia grisea]|uniref:Uncharacterized protein n=1 Tax=Pyricularia grisea TaxID=148305 RepID=A0A6P8APV2_PYRGI|nr:hypothetical protein PgNI_11144 [Pyricularia grisea]TLD04056.1 hypothetical protein PgNI_11144 [Pyricularia grisea]
MDPTLARHVAGTISRYEPNPERPAAYMAREPKTMRDPGTAQWDMEISTADFTQLKLGFMAQEMEDKCSGNARIEFFTWEKALGEHGEISVSERQAKKEAEILCRIHAHCKIEQLPEYSPDIFWQEDTDDEDEEVNKYKDTSAQDSFDNIGPRSTLGLFRYKGIAGPAFIQAD